MKKVIIAIIILSAMIILSIAVIICFDMKNLNNNIIAIASMSFQGMITGLVTFLGLYFTMRHNKAQEMLKVRPKIIIKHKSDAGAEQNAYEVIDTEYCLGEKGQKVRALDCEFTNGGAMQAKELKIKVFKEFKNIDLDTTITLYLISNKKSKLYLEYKDEYGQCYSQKIPYRRKKFSKQYFFINNFKEEK